MSASIQQLSKADDGRLLRADSGRLLKADDERLPKADDERSSRCRHEVCADNLKAVGVIARPGQSLRSEGLSMRANGAKPVERVSMPDGEAEASRSSPGIEHSKAGTLVARFEKVCQSYPEQIAVTCGGEEITYAALNQAANRVAHALRRQQFGAITDGQTSGDTIVAIYLDRSIAMISGMLGILKAGCAYLPIDPTYPAARVAQTLEDASPAIVLTDDRLAAGLVAGVSKSGTKILCLSEVECLSPECNEDLPLETLAEDLAYVMYTSGSTGTPKGVLVTHRNVMRLMTETEAWFHFDEKDVWTMFHSFAFDFSVWEIWGPLLTGGRLVIVPFEVSRSSEDFYALLCEQRVTVLNQTPSAFMLLDEIEEARIREACPVLPLALRLVIFGGEALQYRPLRKWFGRHGDKKPQLVNMYGITETTVHVTYRVVTEADALHESDSLIGEPIPDLQIYLLDDNGHPVADGAEGEMWIGGGGVARGYLNRAELTAQRFVPDTFSGRLPLDRGVLYRSGDLARRRADGQLVYLGRNDHQVKINGFRIELGEVEAAIAAYPGIRQVCVIAHSGETGPARLAAYFVTGGARVSAHTLREFLAERSPAQTIPAFYVQLEEIPLTHNGKVDRKALPTPVAGSSGGVSGRPLLNDASPLQERVATTWREVLEAPNVRLDDNFFDIGGSSILLIRVRAELQSKLARPIPITWMFEFTTIRTLADKLGEGEAISLPGGTAPRDAGLSAAQEQARRQREAFARMRPASVRQTGIALGVTPDVPPNVPPAKGGK